MNKLNNSWNLIKASFAVLKSDKELIVFPIISSIAVVFLTIVFALTVFGSGLVSFSNPQSYNNTVIVYVFLYYTVMYTIIIFSNSALVGAATIRLNGGNPTLKDGIDIALKNFGSILGYAVISATIGLLLRWISDKLGIFGKIFAFISELAWNIVTYLVIPVLVVEGLSPIEAIKKSTSLLKKTWGEQIIGNISIGFVFGLIILAVFIVCLVLGFAFVSMNAILLAVFVGIVFVFTVIAIAVISSTLQSIYIAALYKYAAEGKINTEFNENLLRDSFRRK